MQSNTTQVISRRIRHISFHILTFVTRLLPQLKHSTVLKVVPRQADISVNLPANFVNLPDAFASKFITNKTIPERCLFLLNEVYVNGSAVIFRNMRIYLPSLTWRQDLPIHHNATLFLYQWRFKADNYASAALVYDDWSATNYYHWMIEALPRALMVQLYFPDTPMIIPDPAPEYIVATLGLLNITNTILLPRNNSKVLKVNRLVFPELVYYKNEVYAIPGVSETRTVTQTVTTGNEWIVRVRNLLLKQLGIATITPSRKIFVSRSKQKTRNLLNESEIESLLYRYNYEVIYFEGMSFIGQVQLMLSTRVFCSVHGANMVNMLFLQETARVIELINEDHLNDAYYLLASGIGLSYHVVPCRMADESLRSCNNKVLLNDAHLIVDTLFLEASLQEVED